MKRYGILKFWIVLKERILKINKNNNIGVIENEKDRILQDKVSKKTMITDEKDVVMEKSLCEENLQIKDNNVESSELIDDKCIVEEGIMNNDKSKPIKSSQDNRECVLIEKSNLPEEALEKQSSVEETDIEDKEVFYNDEVELSEVKIDLKYLSHLKEIREVDDYSKLHNRIVRDFPHVRLLCEIEINDDEYKLLCMYFRKKYLQIRRDIGKSVVDVIFSVTLVQIGMRNYDGNFWKHVDDVLGIQIPLSHRTWVGGTMSDTLIAFGKPIFSNQEYVTNVLMHCFVTQSFLIRMYDYLFQYYNLDLQRDIAGMNAADWDFLCASIKNPFGMRKQLLSNYTALSMKANEEYCKSILDKALKLIDMSFWNE